METIVEQLLKEFPPVATAAWEATITRDLKGADYEKRLLWQTEEGITVRPYYRAEDLRGLACLDSAPGEFPFRRGCRSTGAWSIREEIEAADLGHANRDAVSAVAAGADGVSYTRARITSAADLEVLLRGLQGISVHFAVADPQTLKLIAERLATQAHGAMLSTGCDALSNFDLAAQLTGKPINDLVPFAIDMEQLGDRGASAVEEPAFALAAGVEFLGALDERGVPAKQCAQAIGFHFGIGGNYLMELAKLRAFRVIWARAAERFGARGNAARARISSHTLSWNKTAYDRPVNILRSTTEAMAAIVGGADWVTVTPYDACCKEPDEASRRLARNTQLLLRHEAGLGQVADAAGGSYVLESLTDALCRNAWKLFQEIEALGGYTAASKSGHLQQWLSKKRDARDKAVAARKRTLVGVNQFANAAEQIFDLMDAERMKQGYRGAQVFEQMRVRTEWHRAEEKSMPQILLAELGDAKMRGARSGFVSSFFACAGLETTIRRFKKTAEIAETNADMIVLCSSDAEYLDFAKSLMAELSAAGKTTPVLVAGNPESADDLRRAGVADLIHVKSQSAGILKRWQLALGI